MALLGGLTDLPMSREARTEDDTKVQLLRRGPSRLDRRVSRVGTELALALSPKPRSGRENDGETNESGDQNGGPCYP